MSESDNIVALLRRVASFLSAHGDSQWARGFERFANEVPLDLESTKAKVRGCYGGMGSFNDLVLHKERVPLKDENTELDEMRNELWELCQSRAKPDGGAVAY